MHRSSRYPGIVSKVVPPLNEDELEETFTHSGGPGGQHANKVATRVTLKHLPTGLQVSADGERSQQATPLRAPPPSRSCLRAGREPSCRAPRVYARIGR